MRDAKDDLALCEAATPGPWMVKMYYHEKPYEQYIKSVEVVDEDSTIVANNWSNPVEENLDFIAAAREALPYWIKRAMLLQKALRLVCEMVADCTDCPGAHDWPGCGGIDGECNSDEAECWEKYFLEEASHE